MHKKINLSNIETHFEFFCALIMNNNQSMYRARKEIKKPDW